MTGPDARASQPSLRLLPRSRFFSSPHQSTTRSTSESTLANETCQIGQLGAGVLETTNVSVNPFWNISQRSIATMSSSEQASSCFWSNNAMFSTEEDCVPYRSSSEGHQQFFSSRRIFGSRLSSLLFINLALFVAQVSDVYSW